MVIEQIARLSAMAIQWCGAVPYGIPKLHDGKWVIGFKEHRQDEMALQVEFPDRDVCTDEEEYTVSVALESRIRSALLLSM